MIPDLDAHKAQLRTALDAMKVRYRGHTPMFHTFNTILMRPEEDPDDNLREWWNTLIDRDKKEIYADMTRRPPIF